MTTQATETGLTFRGCPIVGLMPGFWIAMNGDTEVARFRDAGGVFVGRAEVHIRGQGYSGHVVADIDGRCGCASLQACAAALRAQLTTALGEHWTAINAAKSQLETSYGED